MQQRNFSSDDFEFVPLYRRKGLSSQDFLALHGHKLIIIFGSGVLGRCMLRQLRRFSEPSRRFVFADTDPFIVGKTIDNCLVVSLVEAVACAKINEAFIILAVASNVDSVREAFESQGLCINSDFMTYRSMCRPEAVIQIAEGRESNSNNDVYRLKLMSFHDYRLTFSKLLNEIPDLFCLDLTGDGEPFLNDDLPDIIRFTEAHVPCTVVTRYPVDRLRLDSIMQARPLQIVLFFDFSIGFPFNADQVHQSLLELADSHSLYGDGTSVRVRIEKYRFQSQQALDFLERACKKFGLRIVQSVGYPPYDDILTMYKNANLDPLEIDKLHWDLEEAVKLASKDRAQPCLCQRIFPVIKPDLSVRTCHLYTRPTLHDNFLTIHKDDLYELRQAAGQCRECQRFSLHRLDLEVLHQRHGVDLRFREQASAGTFRDLLA